MILFSAGLSSLRRRSRLPRASSVASASRCGVQKRRKRSSHASTSRSGSEFTAYSRRVPLGPHGGQAAVPEHPKVLRDGRLGDAELPLDDRAIAPEVSSPSASSSRIRRRTGSPSTSSACTQAKYQAINLYKSNLMNERGRRRATGTASREPGERRDASWQRAGRARRTRPGAVAGWTGEALGWRDAAGQQSPAARPPPASQDRHPALPGTSWLYSVHHRTCTL